MTFGEFIARVYDDCGERRASGLVRFAIQAHLVGFRRPFRGVVSRLSSAVDVAPPKRARRWGALKN